MNNDLISRSELKKHKFVGDRYIQIGGRANGRTLRAVNRAYMMGWNDAIDAIVDNAPTVDTDLSEYSDKLWKEAYERGRNERPHGKWLITWERYIFQCSYCHGVSGKYNFCPNCGADMRE